MSEEKKTIVRDLGFGGLMHIPPLRVHHQILRELANSFKLGENRLETGYSSFKIRPKTIGDALGINASEDLFPQKVNYKDLSEDDKQIFRRFQGDCKDGGNKGKNEKNKEKRKKKQETKKTKKRKESSTSSSETETTDSDNSTSESETQKDSEDSPRKQPSKKAKKMDSKKRKKNQEDSDSEYESTDESEESSPVKKQKTKKKTQRTPKKTQSKKKKVVVEHSSPEQAQSYYGSEIGTEDLDEFLRENNEKSAAEGEKEADLRSTEGHYVSSETIPDVNLESDDPSSQGHIEQSSVNKPAESMLSLVEESASEPAEENMMVVREETPSDGLAINPAPEDAAALMMMAQTTSYVPKTNPMPSFSLGLTDSSQEETAT
ncbi:hypothetical protein AHAS_Ahas15G0323400 [Arachis hypogaea]